MVSLLISFFFRELNEIVKIIESWSNYDTNGYEIDLIKNLELIKNKLQTEGWIERWNELKLKLIVTHRIVQEVIENHYI